MSIVPSLAYYLAFHQIHCLGPASWQRLLSCFTTIEAAWQAPPQDLVSALGPKKAAEVVTRRAQINPARELQRLSEVGAAAVALTDEHYPHLLKEIYAPPPILYYRGKLPAETDWLLSVVGSRKATSYGEQVTKELVSELVKNGATIVSGLAIGIDSIAHQATLAAGGKTVAVLGCGINIIHPPSNRGLAERIVQTDGALISEFPLGTEPLPFNFPQRNRTIAGLSHGTLVTEARAKSGALITARYALEHNREVLAVPADVTRTNAEGTNRLIKDGGRLVSNAQDIFELFNLAPLTASQAATAVKFETENEKIIFELLSHQPIHIDKLVRLARLDISTINATLALLELKGLIRHNGNQCFYRS